MLTKIAINSQSSGKFREESLNGRPHLITNMVSITVDTVMNRILYPKSQVSSSFQQLNRLIAPAGHPEVDGVTVTAFDPLAINSANVGAFVLNPREVGSDIVNELAIDIETAEKDPRGVELMKRIRNSEQVGVSTGLNAQLVNSSGKSGDRDYDAIATNIQFDHVAFLLDEEPAGETTYTINKKYADVIICNLAESVNELKRKVEAALREKIPTGNNVYLYVIDIMLSPDRVIYELDEERKESIFSMAFGYDENNNIVFTGEPIKGVIKRVFEPEIKTNSQTPEINKMDKDALLLAIIASNHNTFQAADKKRLSEMDETTLINTLIDGIDKPVSFESATKIVEAKGMTVNAAFDKAGYDEFLSNKAEYDEFKAGKTKAKDEKVAKLVANSKFTAEEAGELTNEMLDKVLSTVTKEPNYAVQGAVTTNSKSKVSASDGLDLVDFSH